MQPPPGDGTELALGGPGFCGKLPSHGDFVSRRLPPALRAAWEAWLDAGLARSREMLGDKWVETYLSSPIWCFSVGSGCCGDQPLAGVLMPSLDRVGRYFPLSILAPVAGDLSVAQLVLEAKDWFARMETIALSCLADDFDFAAFEQALTEEQFPALDTRMPAPLEIPYREEIATGDLAPLLERLLERSGVRYSLWWTSGSPAIAACCRAFQGLPQPEDFTRLLG